MNLEHLSLLQQLMMVLAAIVLFTSFVLLQQSRIVSAIHAFAWQGVFVALMTLIVAISSKQLHLIFSAALTFGLKGILIPLMLHRQVRRLELEKHSAPLHRPAIAVMVAMALVIFSYWLVLPMVEKELIFTRNIVAISLSVILIGFLMMVIRNQAVIQVLGFMSMENGLFLAAISATGGMPMIVELGVAFDVLVAMILFGLFFFQIRQSIDSLDVDRMNRLSEQVED